MLKGMIVMIKRVIIISIKISSLKIIIIIIWVVLMDLVDVTFIIKD